MAKLTGAAWGISNAYFYNPTTGEKTPLSTEARLTLPVVTGDKDKVYYLSDVAKYTFTIRIDLGNWRHMPIIWQRKR